MPVLKQPAGVTWTVKDGADFLDAVKDMRSLMEGANNHFHPNEIELFKAMTVRLKQIRNEFEDHMEYSPLIGFEVKGLSGLNASMGVNGETVSGVNRHRLWDGTRYLSELGLGLLEEVNSDDY